METAITQNLSDRSPLYEEFMRGSGIGFRFGERAAFDHRTQTVILSASQLDQFGIIKDGEILNQKMFDWIVYHELGHFLQLKNNPAVYKEFIKEGKRKDGFGEAAFEFYNCCLDVHTNKNIETTAAVYRTDEEVQNFYREKLFNKKDISLAPLCQQFSYLILLAGMGIASEYTFSDRIPKVIPGPGKRNYSIEEFARVFLNPKTATGELKQRIDDFLKPIWEELLKIDSAEGRTIELHESLIDADFTEEDCDEVTRQNADQNKTARDRSNDEGRRQLDESLKDIPSEIRETFFQMLRELAPTINELVTLWGKIVRPIESVHKVPVSEQIEGELNIDSVIEAWPSLENVEHPPIFDSDRTVHTITYEPQKINLYLLLDLSGSMGDVINSVGKTLVAIGASIISFNETSKHNQFGVEIVLNLIGYSDNATYFLEGTPSIKKLVDAFSKIKADGGTHSHTAFEVAKNSIDPEAFNILLEVTDGDTSNPHKTKKLLEEICQKGAHVGGIKYTGSIRPDFTTKDKIPVEQPIEGSFKTIWGHHGKSIYSIKFLPRAITTFLEKVLHESS